MSYTIVTDKCEGLADCVDICPIACNPSRRTTGFADNGFEVYQFKKLK